MTSHILALVEAVHGAHSDAVHGFAANAPIVDDVSQITFRSRYRLLSGMKLKMIGCSTGLPGTISHITPQANARRRH